MKVQTFRLKTSKKLNLITIKAVQKTSILFCNKKQIAYEGNSYGKMVYVITTRLNTLDDLLFCSRLFSLILLPIRDLSYAMQFNIYEKWYNISRLRNGTDDSISFKELKINLINGISQEVMFGMSVYHIFDQQIKILRLFDIWHDKELHTNQVTRGVGLLNLNKTKIGFEYGNGAIVCTNKIAKVIDHQWLKDRLPFALTDSARQKCRERSHQFKTVQAPKRHQIVKTLNE